MTILMDPASTMFLPGPPLDLFNPDFAWREDDERSESAYHKVDISSYYYELQTEITETSFIVLVSQSNLEKDLDYNWSSWPITRIFL